jgi:alpha-L-fucosidase
MKKKAEPRPDIMTSDPDRARASGEQPAWLANRLDWFMDQRFGLILHWAPCAQWDCIESWPLVPADTWARPDDLPCWTERGRDLPRFSRDYFALNRTFNPVRFDPDAWAALAKDAGLRYMAFTTKHHDGFCLFDTATTDYKSTHPECPFHTHPKADAVKAVFDAFRRRNMAISCYFSKSDWHSPYYWSPDSPPVDRNPNYDTAKNPERWGRFVDFVHRQVRELMTGYGPIDLLWLDGGQVRPPAQDIRMAEMAAMARSHQPGLIIADRTVGGPYENIITPEQEIPDKPLGVPWESCITLGRHWKYNSTDVFKPAAEVIRMLVETSAKGGNLLLGVGPDALGVIPPEAEKRLREIGAWLRVNGEGIYGARPVPPYAAGPVRFTKKAGFVYAFYLPGDAAAAGGGRLLVEGQRPAPGSAVLRLGSRDPVAWKREDAGFSLPLPASAGSPEAAVVFKFTPES